MKSNERLLALGFLFASCMFFQNCSQFKATSLGRASTLMSNSGIIRTTSDGVVPANSYRSNSTPINGILNIGITHERGMYSPTSNSQLEEGAKLIENLGAKSIFLYLTSSPSVDYPGTDFSHYSLSSLKDLAASPPYARIFAMPYETYVLTVFTYANPNPVISLNTNTEEKEIYELTKYLMATYHGTGKRFILKNWEGDYYWSQGFQTPVRISDANIANAKRYFAARQNGVTRARQEANDTSVTVEHALELSSINESRSDGYNLLSKVVPYVASDWISYSSWQSLSLSLSSVASKIHDDLTLIRQLSNNRPLFISEFGYLDSTTGGQAATFTQAAITAFANENIPFAFFWQILDNECEGTYQSPANCRGFGLLTPNGQRTPTWWALRSLFDAKNDSQIVAVSASTTVLPGQNLVVKVTAKNTGNRPWNSANFYNLGIADSASEANWSAVRGEISSPTQDVMPGDSYEYSVAIKAPSNLGAYSLKLQMVQENVEWFGAIGTVTINVALPVQQPVIPTEPVVVIPTEPVTPNPPSQQENYKTQVQSFYQSFLGRSGSDSEISYWVNQLLANQITIEQARTLIQNSQEAIIRGYYLTYLLREPDPEGLNYWRQQNNNGLSLADIAKFIRSAPECKAQCL